LDADYWDILPIVRQGVEGVKHCAPQRYCALPRFLSNGILARICLDLPEAVVSVLSIIYLIAVVLVAIYGANALMLSILYLRHRTDRPTQTQEPETWPYVTVQLPIYNELYVVKRLINAVARLDYPRHRLQIQVLDDSTDETTRLAHARVAYHRKRGLDITLLHRHDRQGFKAGALARGMDTARGELIAIFDADFVPSIGFLKQVVPYLVADPGLGFVQARWGYLNVDYSTLTRAQTLALDGHFVVEHLGRNRSGLLMNFNGTAGVWRRDAIHAAGGWQSDTLTEDVDLSLRAQLAGWQALYLPDVEAPAELPPQMAAFKRQQARWATGAAQCLVKLAGSLWRGRPHPGSAARAVESKSSISWAARLEALLHLSVWIAHPMSVILLLLTLPLLLGQIPLTFNLSIFWLVALGPMVAYALSQRHLYPDWKKRMAYMPVLALLGTGLALSNTIAIARGLLGRGLPFRRTPKFHIERRGDRWAGSRYVLPFEWVTLGEFALVGYALLTVIVALTVGNYLAVPFLLLYVGGYGYIGLHGLRDLWASRRVRAQAHRGPIMADWWIK
jgi:cellulose synthase/poly-beta-1,6-N-acetylglucosamine synthase-like glycosyltransferase